MSMSSSGSSLTPPVVSYGLVSGINTQQIIQAELQPFEIPINSLQSQQSTLNSNIGDYQQINSDLMSLQTASMQLAMSSGWKAMTTTSSDSAVATATADPGTPAGSLQFTVQQLAAANSVVSTGTASSTSQIVTSQAALLLATGANQLGFATLADGTSDSLGSHTFQVTQSSQAASQTGTTVLGTQTSGITVTTGTSDTITAVVGNGTSSTTYNLTLAGSPAGGYSGSQLLSAVNAAISTAGASGVLQAGYDSAGHLILSTVDQGSSQTLSLSGDALTGLGMTASSSTGVDAVVNVDGTANTISTVIPGAAVTLNGASGATFTATLEGQSSQQNVASSLVQAGTVTATNVSTGSGSLADVVSNINAASAGIVASAVQTGSSQYVLQLSSSQTGTSGDLAVDPNAFSSSSLGIMKTAVAGQNAEIQVGGSSGYTVSSQNDTFTGLLPGLTVNAQQVSSSPVTITVAKDAAAIASSVQSMVDKANAVLSDVQKYAGYDEATKKGGPLMGSATLQGLTNAVLSAFASSVGASNLGSPASIGLKISNGQISFDKTAFESAFNSNPSEVQSLFSQGGTFTPATGTNYAGQVAFSYAGNKTAAGTYAVSVSQSATQATASTTVSGGAVTAGETLTISMGSSSATFTTSSGQSVTAIANGLNSAFSSQGLQLTAQVSGNTLELISSAYGSAGSFTVSTTNNGSGTLGFTGTTATSKTFNGLDVAGTINGVAATGSGQYLTAPSTDPTLAGLSLQVSVPGITTSTNVGTFQYQPGLAQTLSSLTTQYADPVTGSLTQTVKGLQDQVINITPQIQMYQQIVDQQQKLLMAKYATMEATLGGLKNQSAALAGELAKIAANGG